jgi:hypothetical protein
LPPVSVAVSPLSTSMTNGQAQQFTASVTGSANTAVNWSVTPALGAITTAGNYTAPTSIISQQKVTVSAVSVADSTKSASAAITLTPAANTFAPIRVNAGGPSYTDGQGQLWAADIAFSGGSTWGTTNQISKTTNPALYQTCRYGDTFSYQFPVPNGTYTVNLKFAEVSMTASGQRLFNVAINGAPVLTNFDVFAQAGGAFIALDRAFPVTVAGG